MAHHPAAFINALAEEGSKAEAVEWLQKTWNDNCELRKVLRHVRDYSNDPHIVDAVTAALEK